MVIDEHARVLTGYEPRVGALGRGASAVRVRAKPLMSQVRDVKYEAPDRPASPTRNHSLPTRAQWLRPREVARLALPFRRTRAAKTNHLRAACFALSGAQALERTRP